MQPVKIIVNEKPYAIWDWDLKKKNLDFLNGIDSKYFTYVAENNFKALNGDDKHRAAILIRLTFSHGLETLFSLLSSVVQAPQCPLGWIICYSNRQLIEFVKKITKEDIILSPLLMDDISWVSISNLIFRGLECDEDKKKWIIKGFSDFWMKMANIYTNEKFNNEYNGIKHSLRITPGGFNLMVGLEKEAGVPGKPEEMESLGGSNFGSKYYYKKNIIPKNGINITPFNEARNWDPLMLAKKLILVSMSIENIITWLKSVIEPSDKKYNIVHPDSIEQFEELCSSFIGVHNINFNTNISESDITPLSAEEISKFFKEKNKIKNNSLQER